MKIQTKVGIHTGKSYIYRHRDITEWKGNDAWSMLSVAMEGPTISPADALVLDDLFVALLTADPRIWPAKISRLISSYGDPYLGLFAALNLMKEGVGGPGRTGDAVQILLEAERAIADGTYGAFIEKLAGESHKTFRVFFRDKDERHLLIKKWRAQQTTERSDYYDLMLKVERSVTTADPTKSTSFTLSLAAILLDVGVPPECAGDFALLGVIPQLFAHSFEASSEKSAHYRKLPLGSLSYVGRTHRKSSRSH